MSMLNNLRDNKGSRYKAKRVGRGIGSGKGKTSGSGVKGQTSRTGIAINGFEGGQMPLHMRLPKRGFKSLTAGNVAEVRLSELALLPVGEVDLLALKQAGLVHAQALGAKLILSGTVDRAFTLRGVTATAGAKAAIEAAGGSFVE